MKKAFINLFTGAVLLGIGYKVGATEGATLKEKVVSATNSLIALCKEQFEKLMPSQAEEATEDPAEEGK